MLVHTSEAVAAAPVETQELSALRSTFETNTFAPLAVTQAFLPFIRETGARVVFMSALCAGMTPPLLGGLCASKAALECTSISVFMWNARCTPPYWYLSYHLHTHTHLPTTALADALRRELAPYAISVSSIEPSTVPAPAAAEAAAQAGPVYAHLFVDDKKAPAVSLVAPATAQEASFIMRALIHSVSSPHPKVRYPAGRVGPVPARLVAALSWVLPLRLQDALLV